MDDVPVWFLQVQFGSLRMMFPVWFSFDMRCISRMTSRIGSGSQPPSSLDGLSRQISNRASATTPTSAGVATDTPTPSSSAAAGGGTPTPIDGGTNNVVVAGEDANVTVGSKRKLKSDVRLEFKQVSV